MSWLNDRVNAVSQAVARVDPTTHSVGGGILAAVGLSTPAALTGLDPTTHPLSKDDITSGIKAGAAYFVDPSGATSAQIVAKQYAADKAAARMLSDQVTAGPVSDSATAAKTYSAATSPKPDMLKNPLVWVGGALILVILWARK